MIDYPDNKKLRERIYDDRRKNYLINPELEEIRNEKLQSIIKYTKMKVKKQN